MHFVGTRDLQGDFQEIIKKLELAEQYYRY